MPKAPSIKRNDRQFATQLQTFAGNIGNYPALGFTAAEITALGNDAAYFGWVALCQSIEQADGQAWTAYRRQMRTGSGAGTPPAPSTLPTAPTAVTAGIEIRFRDTVAAVKRNTNYTEAIGQALGIEGDAITPPDLSAVTPEINLSTSGNQVIVDWGFGGNAAFLDMIHLEVDRNDGKGFVLLAYDTTPGYIDTTPFPSAPTKWTYRGIYMLGDGPVGNWSAAKSIMVGS